MSSQPALVATDSDLRTLDQRHWVHPMSHWRQHEQTGARMLRRGQGVFVEDESGQVFLDGFAGLWCVNAGYGQQRLVDAATRQMSAMPYATGYFEMGCEVTVQLAAELARRATGDLSRVFFTLGGSDAIDTAIRIITYYNNVRGQPERKHFIGLERGYHGSSFIGSGLTAIDVFHRNFDVPGPLQHHIPSPYPYRHPAGPDGDAIIAATVQALRDKAQAIGVERVAAFICEPIQGGGGVIVPPPGFLRAIRAACDDLGILFIADEVVTGFGRTGTMFGCEHDSIAPDLMSLAKGLTSAYVPMGALMLSERVYREIADAMPDALPFGHGLTYSGHPVGAAVALEVLRLYDEGLLAHGRASGAYFQQRLAELAAHPLVGDVRGRGLLAAVELVADKTSRARLDPALKPAPTLTRLGFKNNLIFRAFGDGTIGFAPALCITKEEVDLLIERLVRTLDAFAAEIR